MYFPNLDPTTFYMVMLDYSNCGPSGEPEVVHIDQEFDYRKTFLAPDFASFVNGLARVVLQFLLLCASNLA